MPRGPKEEIKMEARRLRVSEFYLHGMTNLSQIARELNVDKAQISRDFKIIKEEWRKRCSQDLIFAKSEQLARIDEMMRIYFAAWFKSCDEKQTTSTEQSDSDAGARRKAAIKKESRDGNAAFLAGVQWCISEVCKIRGIYAPVSLDLSRMTTEDLITLAQSIFGTGTHEPGTAGEGQAVSPECGP